MSERSKFIKVRVKDGEYRALRQRADAQGLTMSEHVRGTVTAVLQSLDVVAEFATLRQQMKQAPSAPINSARCCCCASWRQHVKLRRWPKFARSCLPTDATSGGIARSRASSQSSSATSSNGFESTVGHCACSRVETRCNQEFGRNDS